MFLVNLTGILLSPNLAEFRDTAPLSYLQDRNLSSGQRYPPFELLSPGITRVI